MEFEKTILEGLVVLRPDRHGDARGFFSETYSRKVFEEAGIDAQFVQDNHVRTQRKGALRGLHFQLPPHTQSKLLRVINGAVFDVAVDLRHGSPTFGKHVAVEISAQGWNQIFVPRGFAHGYCTLTDDTEVLYKVDAYHALDFERGLAWDDPALGIEWPVEKADMVVNARDSAWPPLSELPEYFQ